jgi:hypothetical protein
VTSVHFRVFPSITEPPTACRRPACDPANVVLDLWLRNYCVRAFSTLVSRN